MNLNARLSALEQLANERLRRPLPIDIRRLSADERARLGELEARIVDVGGTFNFTGWSDDDLMELETLYTRASAGIGARS